MARVTVDRKDVLRWMAESGCGPSEAEARFGIKAATIRSWEHRARKNATAASPPVRRRNGHEPIDPTVPIHVLPAPPPRVDEEDVRENLRQAIRMRAARLAKPVDEVMESAADSARILKTLVESFDLADEKAKATAGLAVADLTTPEGEEEVVAQLRALPKHLLVRAMEAA